MKQTRQEFSEARHIQIKKRYSILVTQLNRIAANNYKYYSRIYPVKYSPKNISGTFFKKK